MSSDRKNFVGQRSAHEHPCCRLLREYLLGELTLDELDTSALQSLCSNCDRLFEIEPQATSGVDFIRDAISVRTTSWDEVLEISPDILERLNDLVQKLKSVPKSFQTRPFDAGDPPEPPLSEVMDFGRYRPQELLGAGGFGEVYLAFDSELERQVAIKTVLPRFAKGEALKRLLPEARAAARLNHPGIVRVFDIVTSEGGRPLDGPPELLDLARIGVGLPQSFAGGDEVGDDGHGQGIEILLD